MGSQRVKHDLATKQQRPPAHLKSFLKEPGRECPRQTGFSFLGQHFEHLDLEPSLHLNALIFSEERQWVFSTTNFKVVLSLARAVVSKC